MTEKLTMRPRVSINSEKCVGLGEEYGHTFTKDQVECVLKESPDTVVIGKGTSGLASLSGDARALLEKRKVKRIEAYTPAIVD